IPATAIHPESRQQFGLDDLEGSNLPLFTLGPKQKQWFNAVMRLGFKDQLKIRYKCDRKLILLDLDVQIVGVNATFIDTYEPTSSFGPSVASYKRLYQLRIEHADTKLRSHD